MCMRTVDCTVCPTLHYGPRSILHTFRHFFQTRNRTHIWYICFSNSYGSLPSLAKGLPRKLWEQLTLRDACVGPSSVRSSSAACSSGFWMASSCSPSSPAPANNTTSKSYSNSGTVQFTPTQSLRAQESPYTCPPPPPFITHCFSRDSPILLLKHFQCLCEQ